MPKNIPWDTRITWYVMKDAQYFDYKDEDFERDAKRLSDSNIKIVMLAPLTHNRMNFYPYADFMNSVLARLVKAFHKYGVQVVEHHSASLTHGPVYPEKGETLSKKWTRGAIDDPRWQKSIDMLTKTHKIEGVDHGSMLQVDGRTGELARTQYDSYVFCYNNEDYRRIYLNYLEKMYKTTGIDGIMNDDIQYFADGNACTCPTCRRLFKEQTGYDLPYPDKWNEFFGDYSNPAFVAFKKFRYDSTSRWQHDIQAHFKSLGYNMLRPNYVSTGVYYNYTFYPFDNCADLWDVMFQENVANSVIRYSYPFYYVESCHRYAFATENDIPNMSMFYCHSADTVYFSWALSMSWAQIFNPSTGGDDNAFKMEDETRLMEMKYPGYFYQQTKKADFAVYFSRLTRDYVAHSENKCMKTAYIWLQTGEFCEYTGEFALETMDLEKLCQRKVIVLPNTYMLSDDEIRRFGEFVRRGGKLVICDASGSLRPDGSRRSKEELASIFGYKTAVREEEPFKACVKMPSGTTPEILCRYTYENASPVGTCGEKCVVASEKCGKGEFIFVGMAIDTLPWRYDERGYRRPDYPVTYAQPYAIDLFETVVDPVLEYAVSERGAQTSEKGRYQVTLAETADRKSILCHLVNVGGTLLPTKTLYTPYDKLDNFDLFSGKAVKNDKDISLCVNAGADISSVKLISPEIDGELPLKFTCKDGKVSAVIPADTFSGYVLAVLEKK